jgi:hypothetical protein
MRTKFFFVFIFLSIFCSTIWGSDLEGFQSAIDQLLQARSGSEKFGYTSTDILKKRLSAFTRDLQTNKIPNFQNASWNSFDKGREAVSHLNFVEKQAFVVDISDMPINDEGYPSTHRQKLPCVSMFDDTNFIAVWEDERNGDVDIFAQKMDFDGDPIGNNFEVSEEDFPKDQLLPCVATTGDSAFVVIWVDEENFDIYGRRFGADLSPLGGVFQVNSEGIPSWAPSLSCGPDGGFVVAWVDIESGNNIYAKRFDASGDSLGESFKVNEDEEAMPHISPSISIGQSGNFVIVWEDYRDTTADIYAQRYGSDGNKLGGNLEVSSDSLYEDQYSPSVSLGKSDRFMVTWVDLKSGIKDVFAVLFSFDGTADTSVFKVDTTTTSDPRENPWVDSDTTGRYMIAWTDYTPSFVTIYTQRFDSLGQAPESRLTISDAGATGERHDPTLSTNPSGAFVVGWMDKRNLNYDIYARTIRSDGSPQQGSDFTINDDSSGANQKFPKVATKSDGGFMVVWEDLRSGNSDIYLKRFDPNGQPLGGDFRVNDSLGYIYHSLPDIACDDSGNFVVVWEDARGGLDIYGQLFDSSGSLIGANFKVSADSGTDLHNSPSCDMSPSGDFVVVWAAREGNVQNIYGRLFWSDGEDTCFKVNDDGQQVGHLCPEVSMDSSGNFIVAWEDRRDNQNRIHLQRYNSNGAQIGSNFPVYSDNPDSVQSAPNLDLNKIGEFVVIWVESGEVLAQRYDSSATRISTNMLVVDNPSSSPEDPQVKVTDNGYFVVAWTDHRGEGSDIYFQIYLNGSPQGLNQLVNTDTGQALQTSAGIDCWDNYLYSVWMDNRIAGHGFDVYFNTVNFKETAVEDDEEKKDLPGRFSLYQNYPNPFNPSTSIQFKVPGGQSPLYTSLKIYNIRGQLVKTLMEGKKPPGDHQVIWNGRNNEGEEVTSGIYFYQLRINDQILTKKMVLLK